MIDIMKLIRDYGASWHDRNHAQNYKAYNRIKAYIQAMQEVCDAAYKFISNEENGYIELVNAMLKLKVIKE